MKTRFLFMLSGLALTFAVTEAALAERFVFVNGARLSAADVASLDEVTCSSVPDGRYWLDFETGVWGYEGIPASQGFIWDNCLQQPSGQQQGSSLSERGMLFSPHDYCPECGSLTP